MPQNWAFCLCCGFRRPGGGLEDQRLGGIDYWRTAREDQQGWKYWASAADFDMATLRETEVLYFDSLHWGWDFMIGCGGVSRRRMRRYDLDIFT